MNLGLSHPALRPVRRFFIALLGFTLLAIGIALIVLPGPAMIVIPIGLAILATEFVWARKTLRRVKEEASRLKERVMPRKNGSEQMTVFESSVEK